MPSYRNHLPVVLTLIFAWFATAHAQTCFWKHRNESGSIVISKQGPGWFTCPGTNTSTGGAVSCCFGEAQCGEDAICHFPPSVSSLGWYTGGCTDPNYLDPVCPQACSGFDETYIGYNDTEQQWHCCGDLPCGSPGTPSDQSFEAIRPADWTAGPSGVLSNPNFTTTMTMTTSTTMASIQESETATGTQNISSNTPESSDSGLSTGAEIGIGVGVGLGVVAAIAAGLLFWCLRRKRRTRAEAEIQKQNLENPQGYEDQRVNPAFYPVEMPQNERLELNAEQQTLYELERNKSPLELQA